MSFPHGLRRGLDSDAPTGAASITPYLQRGVALLLVLLAVVLSTTLALSFVSAQSTSLGIVRNLEDQTRARHIAESGLELAIAYLRADADWRTEQPNGTWVLEEPLGGGSFTIRGEDGLDTNEDGVVEGDGDLADDPAEPFTLSVTGRANGAAYVARAVFTPVPGDARKVLMLLPDPEQLEVADQERKAFIQSWGWEVTLLADSASVSDLADAISDADVVYVPNSANINAGNGALNWPIGMFSEKGAMCPELGFASGYSTFSSSALDIADNTHPITEALPLGSLTIASGAALLEHPDGTLASGTALLARRVGMATPALVVIDRGGLLYGTATPGLAASYFTLGFAPAQLSDIDWTTRPTTTAIVPNVNQAGTGGSAWPGGPADNFAVRLTGGILIPEAGTWTFATNSDDGSDLWIDGARIVQNDGLHSMQVRSGSTNLSAGVHAFQVRGFERSGTYGLIAYWRGPGVPLATVIPASAFVNAVAAERRVHFPLGRFPVADLSEDGRSLFRLAMEWAAGPTNEEGLVASYFAESCCLLSLNDVDWSAMPTATGVVPDVNLAAGNGPSWPGGPSDNFGVRFTGQVTVPESGTWTFYTRSDDGSALWIDGTRVVNNDGLHSMTTRSGTIDLGAGPHSLEVRGFEWFGDYGLIVYWSGPGVPTQTVIPSSALSTGPAGQAGYTYKVEWRS